MAATELANPWWRSSPLVLVGVLNKVFTSDDDAALARCSRTRPRWRGLDHAIVTDVPAIAAIWALELALLVGIPSVVGTRPQGAWSVNGSPTGTRSAIAGSLLASMNTASEYGFGAVIAA